VLKQLLRLVPGSCSAGAVGRSRTARGGDTPSLRRLTTYAHSRPPPPTPEPRSDRRMETGVLNPTTQSPSPFQNPTQTGALLAKKLVPRPWLPRSEPSNGSAPAPTSRSPSTRAYCRARARASTSIVRPSRSLQPVDRPITRGGDRNSHENRSPQVQMETVANCRYRTRRDRPSRRMKDRRNRIHPYPYGTGPHVE